MPFGTHTVLAGPMAGRILAAKKEKTRIPKQNIMKAKPFAMMAAVAIALGGVAAQADDTPAILKNVAAKHQVTKLDKKQMNDVRGDLVLPINLPGSTLTITLLEPNTLLRLNSVGTSPASDGGFKGLNLLNLLFIGQNLPPKPAVTDTYTLGVLDNGQLINYSASRVVTP